jgi:glyoxylase-like metal-dependent hydrolase (beta-lactamase superfamily II)
MGELILKQFIVGGLETNCYLIFDKTTKKGFLVDVPSPADEVKEFIKKENIDVGFVILTHAHFDHIGGLGDFPNDFYIHYQDAPLLKDASLNFSSLLGSPFSVEREPRFMEEANPLSFGSHSIEVFHTPGHTPGSVSVKLGNWLFSGDTLFLGSVGRTDIPLASHEALLESIAKIMKLPPDTIVYPGHGPSTTVGREKDSNPFIP